MTDNNDRKTCERCRFWEQNSSEPSLGHCKRFPPVVVPHNGDFFERSPETFDDDWCGEWQPCP